MNQLQKVLIRAVVLITLVAGGQGCDRDRAGRGHRDRTG